MLRRQNCHILQQVLHFISQQQHTSEFSLSSRQTLLSSDTAMRGRPVHCTMSSSLMQSWIGAGLAHLQADSFYAVRAAHAVAM